MKLAIKLIRNLLGNILVFLDLITRGSKVKREPLVQDEVNTQAKQFTLYQFYACPFCIKTRRILYKLNVPVTKLSASEGSPYREELLAGGGKIQTPCLKIEKDNETLWLYESSEIIKFFEQKFGRV